MITANFRPRLSLQAFILGWLCFVTLPGLLSVAVPESASGSPEYRTQSQFGKLIRPEFGAATSPQANREQSSGLSKRADSSLADTSDLPPRRTAFRLAPHCLWRDNTIWTSPPYSSRAPPLV